MNDQLPQFHVLDESKQDILVRHLRSVMAANQRVNLTRITDEPEGMLLHIEDSLSALPEIEEAPGGRYADIGSGAGYPGIPIAVATGRKTMLVDFRKRKMDEVQGIIEDLDIQESIQTYAGRAELLARSQRECYSVVTARALSKLSVLLELAYPLLNKGGLLVCYKANVLDDEIDKARKTCSVVGMELVSDRAFTLGGEYQRRIITFQKVGTSKVKLPRQEGQAQKNPL